MQSINRLLVYTTAILLIGSALWYGWMIASNEIRPSVATFLLAFVYFGICEMTYWSHNPKATWDSNIALHAGMLNVLIVTSILFAVRILDGNLLLDLSAFHWMCLVASGVILAMWTITKQHALSYCLIQVVALIAYIPTIERVLVAPTQTESNILWVAILFAGLTAFRPTWKRFREDNDWLALVYLARAIPSTGTVVYLVAAKNFGWLPF